MKTPEGLKKEGMRPGLGWFFDFHTPGYVPVNEAPDPEGIAETLAGAGIREATFFTKCHFGYSYYPTEVGVRHPEMKGDIFGGIHRACREVGIEVSAYMSFGLDGQAGERHPEWKRIYANGGSGAPGHFICVCPFTPYLESLVMPQIREIVEAYHPRGFWFDTMSALASCYCPKCRGDFRKEYGEDIPKDMESPAYATYGQWRRARGRELLADLGGFIHGLDASTEVGFNQVGSLVLPEPPPEGISMITLDPATYGQQSLQFSLNAAYGCEGQWTSDLLPTIFNQGWGDQSLASPQRLRQTAAAVWARGGFLHAGDRLHPEGRLAGGTKGALEILASFRREFQAEAPSEDARLAPDILLLHGVSSVYGRDGRYFGSEDARERLHILNGAHRLLVDAGANFAVAPEWNLEAWLDRVALIIIPQIPALEPETLQRLGTWVRRGGTLLCVDCLADSPEAREWLGLADAGSIRQDHIYLPRLDGGSPKDAVLVRGNFSPPVLRDAETILHAILPYHARPGQSYGWGIGPPEQHPSQHPVLTRHVFEKGMTWHLATPLFQDYEAHGNWQQMEWFGDLLRRILPHPRAALINPPGGVEIVLWENSASRWLILINHRGEELFGRGRTWARVLQPLPALSLQVSLGSRTLPIELADCAKILRINDPPQKPSTPCRQPASLLA